MGLFDGIVRIATGNVAHDAADSGNPLKIGGKARTTAATPTAVADGDRVDAWFDAQGRQQMRLRPGTHVGFAYGGGGGTIVSTPDWYVARGASADSFGWPMSTVLATGNVLTFFDSDNGSFDGSPIWVLIPIAENGYTRANITLANSLGVSVDVTAYLIPGNQAFVSVSPLAAGFFSVLGDDADPFTVVDGARLHIGIGCSADDVAANYVTTDWLAGALLLKVDPASDPPSNEHWSLGAVRS